MRATRVVVLFASTRIDRVSEAGGKFAIRRTKDKNFSLAQDHRVFLPDRDDAANVLQSDIRVLMRAV